MVDPKGNPKNYTDPQFANNWSGAASINAYRGAFHFARPGFKGKDQADFFLSIYTPKRGDLLPAIDIESTPHDAATFVAELRDLIAEVTKALGGRAPVIYTQKSVWEALNNPKGFEQCPLWVVDYHNPKPVFPSTWTNYVFWQYAEHDYEGIEKVDFDYFNGPSAEIAKYCY